MWITLILCKALADKWNFLNLSAGTFLIIKDAPWLGILGTIITYAFIAHKYYQEARKKKAEADKAVAEAQQEELKLKQMRDN